MKRMFLLIAFWVLASGSIAADEIIKNATVTLIDDVRIPVVEAAVVERVLVQEGDHIQKGDLVAELDRRLVDTSQRAADIRVEIAQSTVDDDTDQQYARITKDYTDKILQMYQRLDTSLSKIELLRAQLEAAQAELTLSKATHDSKIAIMQSALTIEESTAAKIRKSDRSIRSPISGMVVEVARSPGEWVAQGETVVRVIGLEKLRAKCLVDGDRFDRSLLDQEVELTVSLPPLGQPFQFYGFVTFVSPEIDPTSGLIQVWADIDNPDMKLRAGANGTLKFLTKNSEVDDQ